MRPLPLRAVRLLAAALVAIFPVAASAQVKVPEPPKTYDVRIRYRIQADRNERVLQFEALQKSFAATGFQETPDEDNDLAAFDPTAELMVGTVPSKTARDLLADRRVQTLLFMPAGYQLPADPEQLVRVALELAPNRDQLALYKQSEVALHRLGFRKDIGYDARRFTLLRGSIPVSQVPKLLKDLRGQPSGWVLPDERPELTAVLRDGTPTPELIKPFADGVPIRVVEILGAYEPPPAVVALPPIPADQPQQEKWTADLRRRLAEEGANERPTRLELVLANEPTDLDYNWRDTLMRAGATIEGRVGPVVTVTVAQGAKAADLAAIPDVVSVRLPRLSSVAPPPDADLPAPKKVIGFKPEAAFRTVANVEDLPAASPDEDPLKITKLDRLHAAGFRGNGKRVVVIDTDFAGWREAFPEPAAGRPGPRVKLIDLTAERNRPVRPEPMPGTFGHGTHCALAVRLAAPGADLTLVRVPADAPYELMNVARAIRGDAFRPEGLISRRAELAADIETVRIRTRDANDEYRRAFDNFDDTLAAEKRRIAAQEARRALIGEEKATLERLDRIEDLELGLAGLKGAHVIVCLLNWNTGFALDAASPMSRFLDDWLSRSKVAYQRHLTRPNSPPPPLWFQPAGDTRGQTWTGLFRDADGNGAMEFSAADEKVKSGRWSRELNFLAARSDGKDTLDLRAGAKVRLSVQWREPHDPDLSEFDYRSPVVPLKLQLVRQRDPAGEKAASDEIDVVAESEGLPERLHAEPNFGVYEHSLEVTLPADGRYALRLEGRVPNRVRPTSAPTLESQEIRWELRPRVFVESADGKSQFQLADYASAGGGVAVPADANAVFAIGAGGREKTARPFSAAGAGPVRELASKPNFLAPDSIPKFGDETSARGTALSASFAAGFAASVLSGGVTPSSFPQSLGIAPGGMIEVPESWLRRK